MIYYGEELAEIGSTFAQNRDYFKWSQDQYNNGICDTYNYNNIYPQQTRGNGLINPNDPSDTTTPLNYPITRGLDQQIIDYNSSYNLVKKLIDIRNKNSILQKGEMKSIDEELANTINLEVTNASPDIVQFARKYGTALAFVITNQDPNNTGNVATITFDSSYHDPVYNRSYMVNVLFTNGTVLTDAQTAPTSPQNKIRLAPWESLVISYANNPSANW